MSCIKFQSFIVSGRILCFFLLACHLLARIAAVFKNAKQPLNAQILQIKRLHQLGVLVIDPLRLHGSGGTGESTQWLPKAVHCLWATVFSNGEGRIPFTMIDPL